MNKEIPVWEINGMKLPFDCDDLDTMKKYKEALIRLDTNAKKINQSDRIAYIESYCNVYFMFYDEVFGEGTANKIFNGKVNMRLCDDVYEEFLRFIGKGVVAAEQVRKNRINKYLGIVNKPKKKKNHAKLSH